MTSCPRLFLLSHPGANGNHKTGLMKFVLALLIAALIFCAPAFAAAVGDLVVFAYRLVESEPKNELIFNQN